VENGNFFVVSGALVRAVEIEKNIKVPAVVLSEEISLDINAWVPRFAFGIFQTPILYYKGLTIVNPFNLFWFRTACNIGC
jgi:hypothetical protein